MNNKEYQQVRESIGSQREVATKLGVDIRTVQRREAGEILITFEATRSLLCLSALAAVRGLIEKATDNSVRRELGNVALLLEAH